MENDVIIPKAMSPQPLQVGVHLVMIKAVKNTVDKDKNPKFDRNGNPALTFTLIGDGNTVFYDTIYYGTEKIQWVLDGLMTAIGVNNSTGEISGDRIRTEVIGKPVWLAVKEDMYNDKVTYKRHKYFPFKEGTPKPPVSDNELYLNGRAEEAVPTNIPATTNQAVESVSEMAPPEQEDDLPF